jgi:hypothetical protein
MADIDSIIAGGAKTNADFDFGKINKSYWEGQDQYAKNQLRDAFKDGVPLGADGQPDFGAMAKVLFQKGGLSEGTAASNLDIARQQLRLGQDVSAKMGQAESGQSAQPVVGPSTSRNTVAIDPTKRADTTTAPQAAPQAPQAPQGGATVMKVLAAQGIPNNQLEAASASVARQIGVDPTEPIDTNDPRIRNVLVPAVAQLKRMGIGQVAQPGQPQVQEIPRLTRNRTRARSELLRLPPRAGRFRPAMTLKFKSRSQPIRRLRAIRPIRSRFRKRH